MAWRLRMIARPETAEQISKLEIGDAWYEDGISETHRRYLLAPEHAGKRPLTVRLPGPVHFPVYGPVIEHGRPTGAGWQVVGEPPAITVSPSIHCRGVYHGYIRNGEITDDIEGLTYDAAGRVIRTGR